jgi:hypothetical protein
MVLRKPPVVPLRIDGKVLSRNVVGCELRHTIVSGERCVLGAIGETDKGIKALFRNLFSLVQKRKNSVDCALYSGWPTHHSIRDCGVYRDKAAMNEAQICLLGRIDGWRGQCLDHLPTAHPISLVGFRERR